VRWQVNQRVVKTALLQQYTDEIERLRLDLAAAHTQHGICLSPETYAVRVHAAPRVRPIAGADHAGVATRC
jgi:hypothetical protein